MPRSIEELEEELIQKRHLMEEHYQAVEILMESLEAAAKEAREGIFSLNPYTEPHLIRENQILCSIVEKTLPRIIENIMNAGDGAKMWRYKQR